MKRLLFKLAEASALSGSSPRTLQGMCVDKRTVDLINDINKYGWDTRKVMKLHPYVKFNTNGVGGGAYIGPKFVVKDSCLCDKQPKYKLKCPTVELPDGLLVQPKCIVFIDLPEKIKQEYVKSGKVTIEYNTHYLVDGGSDAHDENFGLLDGKLVQFDW